MNSAITFSDQCFPDTEMSKRSSASNPQPARLPAGDERKFAEANACHRAGDLTAAEMLYRRLLKRHANNAGLREALGVVMMQRGQPRDAAEQFRKAIAFGLREAGTYNNLALALSGEGRLEEAVEAARTAVRLRPAAAEFQVGLGHRLKKAGLVEEAKPAYRRAITLNPHQAGAYVALGNACAAMGEGDAAVAQYRKALELQPGHVRAFYHLALSSKAGEAVANETMIDAFHGLAKGGNLSRPDAILVNNALGFVADRRGEYDKAFGHFRAFNEAVREGRSDVGQPYDLAAHSRFIDRIIEAFPLNAFETAAATGSTRPTPLFIVGMPRSGTTLVEQILGSHDTVAPGGELVELDRMTHTIEDYPTGVWRLSGAELDNLAERYLGRLRRIDPTTVHVSDKLPRNFLHLGLIARLFPGAIIVHCRRDPIDTCLSCYFQNFAGGNDYSNGLTDLGAHYRDYVRLMAHWDQVLPIEVAQVNYEELVKEPEPVVRRLLDAIGLPWDPNCLNFRESSRPVLTASLWQVRQAINKKAVGRWRNYREHLGPLLTALGDLVD